MTADARQRLAELAVEHAKYLHVLNHGHEASFGTCAESDCALVRAGGVERTPELLVVLKKLWEDAQECADWSAEYKAQINAAITQAEARGAVETPAQEPHEHRFEQYTVCAECGQTEAAIEGCHHCNEVTVGRRCWWCLRVRSARPSPPPATPQEWQPIATAKPSQTPFLGWAPWFERVREIGWSDGQAQWCDERGNLKEPTHWMPLPAAPHGADTPGPETKDA